MGSTRLPGKVILEFSGKPMIQHILERLGKSELIKEIVVATSDSPTEEPLIAICESLGVRVFRGSENDVLDRISSLMKVFPNSIHVECFGDSPFIDSAIVDFALNKFLSLRGKIAFLSNTLLTTYPPGMEFMIYEGQSLVDVNELVAKNDPLREHAGYNLSRFPSVFRSLSLQAPPHLNRPETYLELDTVEDLPLVRAVFEHFHEQQSTNLFSLEDILSFLDKHPSLVKHNQNVHRRWKDLRE